LCENFSITLSEKKKIFCNQIRILEKRIRKIDAFLSVIVGFLTVFFEIVLFDDTAFFGATFLSDVFLAGAFCFLVTMSDYTF
jgi:hypothetical protein